MGVLLSLATLFAFVCHTGEAVETEKLTIRVNTFRRLDLLRIFLDHYLECTVVHQIQVVWSDQQNSVPADISSRFQLPKVLFELHRNDSLNNRFAPLQPLATEAVLSIDDDLVVPCDSLRNALLVWRSNKRVLVGFSPRMHALNIYTGSARYLRWQHSWWNGMYSIMLTKIAIFHKEYLDAYQRLIPPEMLQYVDKNRNCEDIAMAYVVAAQSIAPPVWVQGIVYEIGRGGISSSSAHFIDRSACLSFLENATRRWPWVTGYQKAVSLSYGVFDLFRLLQDDK